MPKVKDYPIYVPKATDYFFGTEVATGDQKNFVVGQMVPFGGATGQSLVKNSSTDLDFAWQTIIPTNGVNGHNLTSQGGSSYSWQPPNVPTPTGIAGQVPIQGTGPYNVSWDYLVPAGGTSGQVLGKASGTDFDFSWVTAESPFGTALSDNASNKLVLSSDIGITTNKLSVVAIGTYFSDFTATGNNHCQVGNGLFGYGSEVVTQGNNASPNSYLGGNNIVSIGNKSFPVSPSSHLANCVEVGNNITSFRNNTTISGTEISNTTDEAIIAGYGITVTHDSVSGGVVIGHTISAYSNNINIGKNITSADYGDKNVVVGFNLATSGTTTAQSVNIGDNNTVSGAYPIAIGEGLLVYDYTVQIGGVNNKGMKLTALNGLTEAEIKAGMTNGVYNIGLASDTNKLLISDGTNVHEFTPTASIPL